MEDAYLNNDLLTELRNTIKALCDLVGKVLTNNGWNRPNKLIYEYKFKRDSRIQLLGKTAVASKLDTDEYFSQIVNTLQSQKRIKIKAISYSNVTIRPFDIINLTRNTLRESVATKRNFPIKNWYNNEIASQEIIGYLEFVNSKVLETEIIGLIENFYTEENFELNDKISVETPNDDELLKYITGYPYDITNFGDLFVEAPVNHVLKIKIYQTKGSDGSEVGGSSWAHQMLNNIETAFWLFKNGDIRINRTIQKSLYWSPGSSISVGKSGRNRPLREKYIFDMNEIQEFSLFFTKFNEIFQNKILKLFSRRFRKGLSNSNLEDKIIDYSICFESLFPDINYELRFRLSHYVAMLIEDTYDERVEVYNRIKKFYDIRSRIVHGNPPENINTHINIKNIENNLRSLIKIYIITGGGRKFTDYREARIFGKKSNIDLTKYTYEIKE